MRQAQTQQHIVLKGLLSVLLIFMVAILFAPSAFAVPDDGNAASSTNTPHGACVDRSKQHQELSSNPNLVNDLCRLAKAEVSITGVQDCTQKWIETVFNRAYAQNKTVAQVIDLNNGYWPKGINRPAPSASELAQCKAFVNNALSGSNLNNLATDNASNDLARSREDSGRKGSWCGGGGPRSNTAEFFYTDFQYKAAMEKLKSELKGGCTPKNVDTAPQTNPTSPSTPGGSTSTGGSGSQTPTDETGAASGNQPGSGGKCGAGCDDCADCPEKINKNHTIMRSHVTSEFEQHRNWILTSFYSENVLPAMMLIADHLTANGMLQVQIIGSFFDAKHQLETQRIFQTSVAKAHKDYHPSESLCEIGTNVRSLASSERKANLSHTAFANRMMARQTLQGEGISGGNAKAKAGEEEKTSTNYGSERDRKSRMNTFINKFCEKTDHGEGLKLLCEKGSAKPEQKNMDVNFTQAFENKLTLELDFTKEGEATTTMDEENIFALSANLFGNQILPSIKDELLINPVTGKPSDLATKYLGVRAVAAKRSVAQNSFAAVTALKAEGDAEVAPFLKAILAEAGVAPQDIEKRLGEKPSYFAQMEVLTKDLYQNPEFYTNLYDKPVNIERKGAALQAIELMQDRDLYKSLLRSEAVLATLLEVLLRKEHDHVSANLGDIPNYSEKTKTSGGTTP